MIQITENISSLNLMIGESVPYTLRNIPDEGTEITVNFEYNGQARNYTFTEGTEAIETNISFNFQVHYYGDNRFTFYAGEDGITLKTITYEGEINPSIVYGFAQDKSKVEVSSGGESIVDMVYPIGSIYMSVNSANPSTLFGGTWVAWGSGRVPVGVDTSQTEFNTVEKMSGEKSHKLTENEMPSHYHDIDGPGTEVNYSRGAATVGTYDTESLGTEWTSSVGGNGYHNNLQPYITCYMWKRTA